MLTQSNVHSGIIISHCWTVSHDLTWQRMQVGRHDTLPSSNRQSSHVATSLCRIIGKAPCGQQRAWDKVKSLPHTQCEGNNDGVKAYHKQMASMNSPLWREKPYCSSGNADNQEEVFFSMQHSTAQHRGGGQLEMETTQRNL